MIGLIVVLILGILQDVTQNFHVKDDQGGLLQTAFVMSYMIFAPLFGYLGDRYSRKAIMAAGVFLWSITTLLGSFMNVSLVTITILWGLRSPTFKFWDPM